MRIRLPSTYQPAEWDALSDDERRASIELAAWYRSDRERIRERLREITLEIQQFPDQLTGPAARVAFRRLLEEEDALERMLDRVADEDEVHDVD